MEERRERDEELAAEGYRLFSNEAAEFAEASLQAVSEATFGQDDRASACVEMLRLLAPVVRHAWEGGGCPECAGYRVLAALDAFLDRDCSASALQTVRGMLEDAELYRCSRHYVERAGESDLGNNATEASGE